MTAPLAGCAAAVAGGSRGIGREVALALAGAGAAVVVNGRDCEPVEAVVGEIGAAGERALASAGSVADFAAAGRLVEACIDAFGRIDALVNCAGVAEPPASSILEMPPEAWREVLDIHLTGTFNTCRHAAPHMRRQGAGAIVNTSSHAFLGIYGGSAYPAAKGGTNSLTLAMAAELRPAGVRCNAVCPGARTRISSGRDYERRIERLRREGVLDDGMAALSLDPPDARFVAPLYAVLASELAAGVTGRIFSASGGYVGLFDGPGETLVAFKDHRGGDAWSPAELAGRIGAALAPRGARHG